MLALEQQEKYFKRQAGLERSREWRLRFQADRLSSTNPPNNEGLFGEFGNSEVNDLAEDSRNAGRYASGEEKSAAEARKRREAIERL